MEGKILTTNYPSEVTIFTANFWKLITIHNLQWLNSRPATVKNATLYFHLLS